MNKDNAVAIVPSMTDSGWGNDSGAYLDNMLANAYATQYSQSNKYFGTILSMAKLFKDFTNPDDICTNLENKLKEYLYKVFKDVKVSVTHTEVIDGHYDVHITGEVVDTYNDTYALNHSLPVKNNKLTTILKYNNA